MLSSVVSSNPHSGMYQLSVEDSALFKSLAKKTAGHIVREYKDLVDNFAGDFFREVTEAGGLIGPDGQPVKPSPEQMEAWIAEYKKDVLNQVLKDERERLKESSQKKLAQAEKLGQEALTEQFWSIFNGRAALPKENYNRIFDTYLTDRSLTVEKSSDGISFGRINSMSSVIKYLKDHPLTKTCDFRTFKTEVYDVETLVNFLKTPDAYAIKALAFKSAISEIAKQKLAEVTSARASSGSPLKVQYFA